MTQLKLILCLLVVTFLPACGESSQARSKQDAPEQEPALRFRLTGRSDLVDALNVVLVGQSGESSSYRLTETNVDGEFTLPVPPDDYTVTVVPVQSDHSGLAVVGKRVNLSRGGEALIEVACDPPAHADSPTSSVEQSQPSRNRGGQTPNIVLILLDDFDYTDLRCNGVRPWTRTPRMDQLAGEGVRFTQFYSNGAKCSPTRASILTSRFPAAFGWRNVVGNFPRSDGTTAPQPRCLPSSLTSLAEVLSQRGYATGHIGKWHVGEVRPGGLPLQSGFAEEVRWVSRGEIISQTTGNGMYWGYALFTNGVKQFFPQLGEPGADDSYLTKKLTDEAIAFVERHQGEPFFLNLWHVSIHHPLHVPPAFDNSVMGYDLSSNSGKIAAMVSDVDREIGRLVDRIDELGLASNTLIIVTSDNGGTFVIDRQASRQFIRGAKGSTFEGGVRVPFVARWKGKIPAGSTNLSIASTLDLLPTLADAASATPPTGALGRSLYDNMVSGTRDLGRDLFWLVTRFETYSQAAAAGTPYEHLDNYGVRSWKYKLVSGDASNSYAPRLFDLSTGTRGEFQDVAAQNPVVALDLYNRYRTWRRTAGDFPSLAQVRNGVAELAFDERQDFVNSDFTFVVDIDVDVVDQASLIALRSGCWRLIWNRGRVMLHLYDNRPSATLAERQVELVSPSTLGPGRHRIAFTVLGQFYAPENLIPSLYIDGTLARRLMPDQFPAGKSLFAVQSNSAPIQLGAYPDGSARFLGTIHLPRMSTLSLNIDEIWP